MEEPADRVQPSHHLSVSPQGVVRVLGYQAREFRDGGARERAAAATTATAKTRTKRTEVGDRQGGETTCRDGGATRGVDVVVWLDR